MLKELISKLDNYTIITTLNIDSKIKEFKPFRFIKESKKYRRLYVYNLFNGSNNHCGYFYLSYKWIFLWYLQLRYLLIKIWKKIKYYNYVKPIYVKDRSKIYQNLFMKMIV